jgi:hypothetical protein
MPGPAGDLARPAGRAHGLGAADPRGAVPPGGPGAGQGTLRTGQGLAALRAVSAAHLPPAGQLQVATALAVPGRWRPGRAVRHQLLHQARHLAGAKVLAARLYGVGPFAAPAMTCWLGGAGRFSSSGQAARFAGPGRRRLVPGPQGTARTAIRQGPPVLRRAVSEAGRSWWLRPALPARVCRRVAVRRATGTGRSCAGPGPLRPLRASRQQ